MSGWNRQTDRGGEIEGGGRLMERERAGWTESNGRGLDASDGGEWKGVDSSVFGHHTQGPPRSQGGRRGVHTTPQPHKGRRLPGCQGPFL